MGEKFVNHRLDKGLIFRIYKELSKLSKNIQSNKEMGKRFKQKLY